MLDSTRQLTAVPGQTRLPERAATGPTPCVDAPPMVDGAAGVRGRWALALSGTRLRRGLGVVLVAGSVGYLWWLASALNTRVWWLSVPFVAANAYLVMLLLVSLANNWSRSPLRTQGTRSSPADHGDPPVVAVLVPTWNEPAWMLGRTVRSVLAQDWPHGRLVLVVGDDGDRPAIRDLVRKLAAEFPTAHLHYHLPPVKGSSERRGDAKDGNLNSMLDRVRVEHPDIAYVETRDADDLVGDRLFLRHTVGLLGRQPDVGYVQTAKDALVSTGDPFGNRRTFFYRGIMLSRDAGGAAFPCGSGLVWRLDALLAIGGFPTWNLVEDLYSGYLALQRGYRGRYLPILGALAQTAPEDVPNVYQQLGTWALDTLRIFFWRPPWRTRLRWRQRLHFVEMGLFYLSALPTLALIVVPALCLLFDVRALRVDPLAHAVACWAYTMLITAFTFVLGNGTPWREMVRAKQIWVGLTFVYARACVRALWYGPGRKPVYRVTRKFRRPGIYLWQVAPHLATLALLGAALSYHLWTHGAPAAVDLSTLDLGSIFWVLLYGNILAAFVRRSWYGIRARPVEVTDGGGGTWSVTGTGGPAA